MQNVGIHTTQNVFIHHQLAGLGDRIVAYLLDLAIIAVYGVSVFFIIALLEIELSNTLLLIFFIPIFFYDLFFEIFMDGQSLGKRQMGIKVVKLDGTQPGVGSYLLRWILRPIDVMFYGGVAILCIVIGGKGQRLGDIPAGTTVVKLARDPSLEFHQPMHENWTDHYQPSFANVTKLKDKDIELIKQVLKVYRESANQAPVAAITKKVKALLEIKTDMPPVKLLNVLIKDYRYYTSQV